MNRLLSCSCLSAALFFCAGILFADTFGSGANSFDVDFVTIGNPGDPPDANGLGAGAVPYSYRIGKYEISEQMIDKANVLGGLGITKDTRGPDYPATSVTWYEAAKFVDWLDTSSGSVPAYKFDVNGNFQLWQSTDAGYDLTNLYRNKLAKYFLPSVHEWHKAAYYDPASGVYYTYPTGSNDAPTPVPSGTGAGTAVYMQSVGPASIMQAGGLSPYGTMAQGGNAYEWVETAGDWINNATTESRTILGGTWGGGPNLLANWNDNGAAPNDRSISRGFRVAATVPEPSSVVFVVTGIVGIFAKRMRRPFPGRFVHGQL